MNFTTDSTLTNLRIKATSEPILMQAIPLVLMIFLENKISRHYLLGQFHKLMTHSLTVLLMINYLLEYFRKPIPPHTIDKEFLARQLEHSEFMALIGNATYLAIIVCCIVSTVYFKFTLGKTWDNASVRCGFFIAKAAILVTGYLGPIVYFCMLLQWYNIALVINHRRDSIPGKSFPIQVFLAFFTMQQYFLRSNHRERLTSVQFGKVCPGQLECNEIKHWILIIFEIAASYFIGLQLLPLIVKARVQHVHAHLRPHGNSPEPVPVPEAPKTKKKKKGKVAQ